MLYYKYNDIKIKTPKFSQHFAIFRSVLRGDQTMNTEHQNLNTQLPRAIEERPTRL